MHVLTLCMHVAMFDYVILCFPHIKPARMTTENEYCTTGNVNEQVMLTNLTSGMGSLLFLPR